ncbi:hypothetical protein AB0B27_06440 [Micromonospora rifamycinica]|uniref:hypothetical protein n=1 Tax=Micromonospora rifamycinica TaxID=291594 RepID=UPI0033ED6DF3
MPYQPSDLQPTYNEERGYWHFVLYLEPGMVGSACNASQSLRTSSSPYAAEWMNRLVSCAPDALHVTLVGPDDAPRLWHDCVYDDPESPSAVGGAGCLCWQTSRDPVTGLPVAANHYRTVSGNIEHWTHNTYAPLGLPDGQRLQSLIIDREAEVFWVRTDHGVLHFLPEEEGNGYNVGYGGGGPTELASMIEKIIGSDGYDITPGTSNDLPGTHALNWTSSKAADRTQELTLDQLKLLCRTGQVT